MGFHEPQPLCTRCDHHPLVYARYGQLASEDSRVSNNGVRIHYQQFEVPKLTQDSQNKGRGDVKLGNVTASYYDIDVPSACLLLILSYTGRSWQADWPNFLSLLNPVSGVGVSPHNLD